MSRCWQFSIVNRFDLHVGAQLNHCFYCLKMAWRLLSSKHVTYISSSYHSIIHGFNPFRPSYGVVWVFPHGNAFYKDLPFDLFGQGNGLYSQYQAASYHDRTYNSKN